MFECPICYQRRRKLVTLQCHHTLCHFCWQKWSKKELTHLGKPWPTCPCCRAQQKPWYLVEEYQWRVVQAAFVVLFVHYYLITVHDSR